MNEVPVVLGIHRKQDASTCPMHGAQPITSPSQADVRSRSPAGHGTPHDAIDFFLSHERHWSPR